MKKLVTLLAVIFISACARTPVMIERIPFNEAEFLALPASGSATVTGKAFIKTTEGTIHFAQNEQVRLNPKTSYSQQWYEVNYLGNTNITDADPRYLNYVRKATVDEKGIFTFSNVPAGDYYISVPVFWFNDIKMEDGSIYKQRLGKFICYEIHVVEGQTTVAEITTSKPFNVALSM